MFYREQTFAPRAFHSELQQQTNAVNTQKSPPWACDKGCAEACAERFSALNNKPNPCLKPMYGVDAWPLPQSTLMGGEVVFPLRHPCSPLPSPKKALVIYIYIYIYFFFLQRTLSVCPASATARYTSALQTCSTMMTPRIFCTLKCCLTMETCWWVSVALQLFKTSNLFGSLYVTTHLISG